MLTTHQAACCCSRFADLGALVVGEQEAHSADERLDAIERKIKSLRRKAEYR